MAEVKKYEPRLHERQAAEIYAASFSGWPWFEKWTPEDAVNELRAYHKRENTGMFVVEEKGKVVGIGIGFPVNDLKAHGMSYLKAKVPQGAYYLADLAVHPEHRRKGFASLLVKAREAHAASLGCPAVFGRTRADNVPKISQFKKDGYAEIHRAKAVTGGVESERAYYLKRLRPRA
ncbi:MAG: GNAT family N-acetyltransferase [Candidatus Micrarchaeota archaeon]